MAIDRSPYRQAFIDRPEQLRRAKVSVLAERLYSELERGRWSNMAGLCWWHADLVRVSLREHSRAKVEAALDELEACGFASVDRQLSVVLLPLESQAAAECGPNHRQGLRAICQTFPSCAQTDLLLEIIANVEKGLPRSTKELPKTSGVRNRSKEQNQEQESSASDKPKRARAVATTKEPSANTVKARSVHELWTTILPQQTAEVDGRFYANIAKAHDRYGLDTLERLMRWCARDQWENGSKRPQTLAQWCAEIPLVNRMKKWENATSPTQMGFAPHQPSEVNIAYERHLAEQAAKEKANGQP